jgi:hypothetical protein
VHTGESVWLHVGLNLITRFWPFDVSD